jgi:hypothetical protein
VKPSEFPSPIPTKNPTIFVSNSPTIYGNYAFCLTQSKTKNTVFFVLVCEDNDEASLLFTSRIGRIGTCAAILDMCNTHVFFIDGLEKYDTVSKICPKSCDVCPGTINAK